MHVDFYNGQFSLNWIEIRQPVVGIGDEQTTAIEKLELLQNYPNPFNPSTQINFNLPKATRTSIEIFNIRGQLIKTLIHKQLNAGEHSITWNASDVPSGIYFYRLVAGEETQSKKMILIK